MSEGFVMALLRLFSDLRKRRGGYGSAMLRGMDGRNDFQQRIERKTSIGS
jgi:hypothetical protein